MYNESVKTGTDDLLAWRHDRVLVLTMNRPAARNALSDAMLDALEQQLAAAESDDGVGCIVLTGAEGAFCTGGDVKTMLESNGPAAIELQRHVQNGTAGRLFSMPKPTIAAINGPAAGAGFSLAMACDLRTMSHDAFLTTAFVKVGLPGDFGGAYFVSQLVGSARARELFFLSERVSAEEALALGLANRVFAPANFMSETMELAQRLASGPSVALGFMKDNLNRALTSAVGECMDVEVASHLLCTKTFDHHEGVTAFLTKRTPKFQGQ